MSMSESMLQQRKICTGLSDKEAKRKLQEHGRNTITHKAGISALKIIFDQFNDFMVLILLASTVISIFMGETTEAVTIIAIVIVNAVLGFIQEYRTERTLEALKELAAPTARVVRGGKLLAIPAEEIVPGDLMVLEAGDRVAADSVIVESFSLQVDESLLTGESLPVEKTAGEGKSSSVYMGTVVTGGRAKALVYATGMRTEMGKIADMIQSIEEEQTPLQKHLDHMGKYIVFGCLMICMVVSVTGILRGEDILNMLLSGISLAVAAIPEGLPAIVTISLALGVQRMLKRNALIRKLPAVETLGCAGVICSDKTGTLTENRMTVRKLYTNEGVADFQVTAAEAFFTFGRQKSDVNKSSPLKTALEIGILCNNAVLTSTHTEKSGIFGKRPSSSGPMAWKVEGDPTEGALLMAAAKAGFEVEELNRLYQRIDEVPFDSERKCMSVICKSRTGETYVFSKGAPDVILKTCTGLYTSAGIVELTPSEKAQILKMNDTMAGEALRVLGLAFKKLHTGTYDKRKVESNLVFVGLIGMIDPPRKEAAEAVQKCRLAGIKPIMITGDHKITATAIAKEIGIYTPGERVLTGTELEAMDENRLEKLADHVSVYARVSPRHKLIIVKALKKRGHVVAMTGDGVNDAPAVKEADIGVSMGLTGTDVTKEASSMILTDDNFATIVAAVEEGRVIYSNIRKFIRYLLACNIGEVLTMFLGTLAGFPIPLLPIQILWVNLVTDGLPAAALGLEPAEKDIMMRPPRSSKDGIFSDGLLTLIIMRGILLSISTLAVFVSILYFTQDVALARTGALVTLVLTQLTHVFECKSETKTLFEIPIWNNKALIIAVLCSLAMILSVVYIPLLQPVFKTVPLTWNEWSLVIGFTMLGPLVSGIFRKKRTNRRRRCKKMKAK